MVIPPTVETSLLENRGAPTRALLAHHKPDGGFTEAAQFLVT